MNENIIDVLLQRFETVTTAAFATVGNATMGILWMLAGIAVALAVVFNMFGGKTPWMALFSKVIMIGFFSWLVMAWPEVIKQVQETFIQVGLMSGGSSMSAEDFMSPSKIAEFGDEVAGLLFKAADDIEFGFSFRDGFSGSVSEWIAYTLAAWVTKFGYWLTALMVFASLIIFFVSSVISLFLVAFMVFAGTAWIGRGALGWLVSAGTMLMALAAVSSIMVPIFKGLTIDEVDQYAANQALLAALAMIVLVIAAGAIARGIGNGVATFGMGAAVSTAASAAVVTGAAVAGTAMLGGAAARAATSQMQAARVASAAGPKLSMNSPASYMKAGKIEDASLKGRAAAAGRAHSAAQSSQSTSVSASASQPASRGLKQIANRPALAAPNMSMVGSIMMARAAVPEIADEGPSLQPTNI
jgi:type IV secretion system protein TrbL